jgi:uncharacterized protein YoxC
MILTERSAIMGIALIVMGGLTLISIIAIIGDTLTKARRGVPSIDQKTVQELAKRVEVLEQQVQTRDARLEQLENDVSFANRLLEDKHK